MPFLPASDQASAEVMRTLYEAGERLIKAGDDTSSPAYNLRGVLVLAGDGSLRLLVPIPFVRGLFSAMHEPGIELYHDVESKRDASIEVMSKSEVDVVYPDRITERGKAFAYTTGRFYEARPPEHSGASKIWVLRIHSPELQALRRSYGLSSMRSNGTDDFYIPIAMLKRGVLGRNETAKE